MERKVTRLYTGPDGRSHFEDIVIHLEDDLGIRARSETMKATGIMFQEMYSDYKNDWHNPAHRQFVITLEGAGEIEIGDGTKRQFRPGDILLAEDTTGQGHITRVLNNQPRKIAMVSLD